MKKLADRWFDQIERERAWRLDAKSGFRASKPYSKTRLSQERKSSISLDHSTESADPQKERMANSEDLSLLRLVDLLLSHLT